VRGGERPRFVPLDPVCPARRADRGSLGSSRRLRRRILGCWWPFDRTATEHGSLGLRSVVVRVGAALEPAA